MNAPILEPAALETLLDLLAIEGLSGQETQISREITRFCRSAGVSKKDIGLDGAEKRIGRGFEIGNLLVRLPGTRRGPRRLFMTHMDTVPLCRGARPVRKGDLIVPAGPTALGGDNRTGCACLITMIETILREKLDHPPLTILFTVGEEIGLLGSRHLRKKDLRGIQMGFNVDGGTPSRFVVGAIGSTDWRIEVEGIAAHAGAQPERGVSAAIITAKALEKIHRDGWFGKIEKGRNRGTANVGRIEGGQATNEVTPRMTIEGESRSHQPAFRKRIVAAYEKAFARAARAVRNVDGISGTSRLEIVDSFEAFRISARSDAGRHAARAARAVGLDPEFQVCNGGLDATPLNEKGIPTVTFGAGQNQPHSLDEHVNIPDYFDSCRLAVALATL
ncbi:MAG: M20/M25/M40 family metallo-hydrolase [Planctomycetota bacterium]|nr:M20/M25/M40 family metallo-hydrolase [Planctomycetota bacterium]